MNTNKNNEDLPDGHVDKIETIYRPKKGDYFLVEGKSDSLKGKIILANYRTDWEATRCYGPLIGDFNNALGNLTLELDSGCCFEYDDRKARPATLDEIKWLDVCIKANKFIPKEKALKSIQMEEYVKCKTYQWASTVFPEVDYNIGNCHEGNKELIGKIFKVLRTKQEYKLVQDEQGKYATLTQYEVCTKAEFEAQNKPKIMKEMPKKGEFWVYIDAEVTNIKLPRKSASVTLKNTEKEVNILVKTKQTIKIN